AYDVANVDAFVRDCLGRIPVNTPIEFVSPHWHGDHINVEFIRELGSAGYPVRGIWFHEDDDANIRSSFSWSSAELALFRTMPDAGCNVEIGTFESSLGKVWFTGRSGHTAGAIDLVLDVRGNPNDRVLLLGSQAGGSCPTPPSGVRWTHNAHGNARITISPEVVPFGCGLNAPDSLTVLEGLPKLGTTMGLGLDDPRGDVAPGATPMLFASLNADPALPCGTVIQLSVMVRPQELLINSVDGSGFADPLVGLPWMGPGAPSAVYVSLPLELSAVGSSFYLQGGLFEFGVGSKLAGLSLTEGLELRLAQ
ncbi:MAG: hypothetical protein ACI9K5_003172, partial [Gammaproteobacteria bacterium]